MEKTFNSAITSMLPAWIILSLWNWYSKIATAFQIPTKRHRFCGFQPAILPNSPTTQPVLSEGKYSVWKFGGHKRFCHPEAGPRKFLFIMLRTDTACFSAQIYVLIPKGWNKVNDRVTLPQYHVYIQESKLLYCFSYNVLLLCPETI